MGKDATLGYVFKALFHLLLEEQLLHNPASSHVIG
jgi:hypothetical protein